MRSEQTTTSSIRSSSGPQGRYVCLARTPRCEECVLIDLCDYFREAATGNRRRRSSMTRRSKSEVVESIAFRANGVFGDPANPTELHVALEAVVVTGVVSGTHADTGETSQVPGG